MAAARGIDRHHEESCARRRGRGRGSLRSAGTATTACVRRRGLGHLAAHAYKGDRRARRASARGSSPSTAGRSRRLAVRTRDREEKLVNARYWARAAAGAANGGAAAENRRTGIMILLSGVDQRCSAVAFQQAIAARARAPWRARGKRFCAVRMRTGVGTGRSSVRSRRGRHRGARPER